MTYSSKVQKIDPKIKTETYFCSPRLRVYCLSFRQTSSNLRIKVERQIWFWRIKSSLLTHLGDEPFHIRAVQFN